MNISWKYNWKLSEIRTENEDTFHILVLQTQISLYLDLTFSNASDLIKILANNNKTNILSYFYIEMIWLRRYTVSMKSKHLVIENKLGYSYTQRNKYNMPLFKYNTPLLPSRPWKIRHNKKADAAVKYLRMSTGNNINITIVMAKSRVIKTRKQISISRIKNSRYVR